MRQGKRVARGALLAAGLALAPFAAAGAETGAAAEGDGWAFYGGDPGHRKHAPLAQIHAGNVSRLELAWAWESVDGPLLRAVDGAFADNFKGTPLHLDGRLFIRTQLGQVAALDPETGRTLWVHGTDADLARAPVSYGFTTRGLASWTGPDGRRRLLFTTPGRKLKAIHADDGSPVPGFGTDGAVDLDASLRRQPADPRFYNYGNQVPVIVDDVIVLGGVVADSEFSYVPPADGEPPLVPVGDIRGFDAATGRHLWTFHTVPQDGETGNESWGKESWRWMGSTNVWSLMSADPDRHLVFAPVTAPTFNYYGGFRPGDNLFAQSIVALDARTGRRVWHYQTIHHPIWDYDLPAAPVLADLSVGGRTVPALIQIGKTGFIYVLDRRTGEPVWPIEERPVPQSTVPGEVTSPTQPFPTRPPPFAQQGIDASSVNDITPEIRAEALALVETYGPSQLFTPFSLQGTFHVPAAGGGGNWPGGAFDPDTGYFYVTAINYGSVRSLARADNWYGYIFKYLPSEVKGLPLVKPPWGTLTAYDMNAGELLWQIPNGEGPRRHPDFAGLDLPDLGVAAKANPLLTKSLLFLASSGQSVYGPPPEPGSLHLGPGLDPELVGRLKLESHAMFRAYDKASGAILWEHPVGPAYNDGGAPMTYMQGGRQYIVLPTGGLREPSFLLAFALPRADLPPADDEDRP